MKACLLDAHSNARIAGAQLNIAKGVLVKQLACRREQSFVAHLWLFRVMPANSQLDMRLPNQRVTRKKSLV